MTAPRRDGRMVAALVALAAGASAGCGTDASALPDPVVRWPALGTAPRPSLTAAPRVAAVEQAGLRTRLVVVDVRSGRRRVVARSDLYRGGDAGLAMPAFSPDGTRVAAAEGSNTADEHHLIRIVVAAANGAGRAWHVPEVRLVDVDELRPVWTPDGRALAIPAHGGVDLVDVRTGHRRPLLRHSGSRVAFAPDGKAYTFDGPGGVWLATRSGPPRLLAQDADDVTWSPDGRRMAYRSARDHHGEVTVSEGPPIAAHEIYVARRDGRDPRRMTRTLADEMGPLRWTLDGRGLVFSRFSANGQPVARVLVRAPACEAPLAVPAPAAPASGDVTHWDVRATSAELTRACRRGR